MKGFEAIELTIAILARPMPPSRQIPAGKTKQSKSSQPLHTEKANKPPFQAGDNAMGRVDFVSTCIPGEVFVRDHGAPRARPPLFSERDVRNLMIESS